MWAGAHGKRKSSTLALGGGCLNRRVILMFPLPCPRPALRPHQRICVVSRIDGVFIDGICGGSGQPPEVIAPDVDAAYAQGEAMLPQLTLSAMGQQVLCVPPKSCSRVSTHWSCIVGCTRVAGHRVQHRLFKFENRRRSHATKRFVLFQRRLQEAESCRRCIRGPQS